MQFIPLPASPALSATATSDEEAGLSSSSSLSSLSDGLRTPPALDLELVTPVVAIVETLPASVVVEAATADQKEAVAIEQQLAPASLGLVVAPAANKAATATKAKKNKTRRTSKPRPIPRVRTQESAAPIVFERTIFNSEDPDVVASAFSVHAPPAITLDFPIAVFLPETATAVTASPVVPAPKPTYTHKRFRPSTAARLVNAALQSAQVATGVGSHALIFGGVASAYAADNKTFQIGSATISFARRPDHTRPRSASLGSRVAASLAEVIPKRLIHIDLAALSPSRNEMKLYFDNALPALFPPAPAPTPEPTTTPTQLLLASSITDLDNNYAYWYPAPSIPTRFKGFRVVLIEGTVDGHRAVLKGARRVVRFGFGENGGWEERRVWAGRVESPLRREVEV